MTREELQDLFYKDEGITSKWKQDMDSRVLHRKGMIDGYLSGMKKGFLEKSSDFQARKDQAVLRGMDKDGWVYLNYHGHGKSFSIQPVMDIETLNNYPEEKVAWMYFIFKTCKEMGAMLLKAGASPRVWSNQMEFMELPNFEIILDRTGKHRLEFSKHGNGY